LWADFACVFTEVFFARALAIGDLIDAFASDEMGALGDNKRACLRDVALLLILGCLELGDIIDATPARTFRMLAAFGAWFLRFASSSC
jgi:hypothetical protein